MKPLKVMEPKLRPLSEIMRMQNLAASVMRNERARRERGQPKLDEETYQVLDIMGDVLTWVCGGPSRFQDLVERWNAVVKRTVQ